MEPKRRREAAMPETIFLLTLRNSIIIILQMNRLEEWLERGERCPASKRRTDEANALQ